MADDVLHIRSFRVVFDLERRIHRIDRFRVPLPYGLPLRSVAYALVGLVAVLLIGRLPVGASLVGALPAPARYVLLPVAASYALTQLRLDGRSAHAAAASWLRYAVSPRSLVAFRALPSHSEVHLGSLVCVSGQPRSRRRRISVRTRLTREAPPVANGAPIEPTGRDQLELW